MNNDNNNRTLIENVIRDEVRKVMNLQQVPTEDNPLAADGLEPVPANDMPNTILEPLGMNNQDMRRGGANDAITLADIQAGRRVEPREALENSIIDPLTAVGTGALLKVPREAVGKNAANYASKRKVINDRISNSQGLANGSNLNPLDKIKMRTEQVNSKAETLLDKKPFTQQAAEKIAGILSPSLKKSIANTWDKFAKYTSPKAAYNAFMKEATDLAIKNNISVEDAFSMLLKGSSNPYRRVGSFNRPIVNQTAKGAAANSLLGNQGDK